MSCLIDVADKISVTHPVNPNVWACIVDNAPSEASLNRPKNAIVDIPSAKAEILNMRSVPRDSPRIVLLIEFCLLGLNFA